MWYAHHGGWGPGGWIWIAWMVLFWGGLLVTAVYFIRHRRPPAAAASGTAEMFLAERYARGEIDTDEYRRRQAVLREHPDSDPPAR
jgi:putative membrane protein